jgi:hypothetical protein
LVAKALAPFRDRLLGNEPSGGTFHRQSQESILLINPITDYSVKYLFLVMRTHQDFASPPCLLNPMTIWIF